MTAAAWAVTGIVAALTLHTVVNVLLVRRPPADPSPVEGPVSVLVPVRDEERHVGACLRSVLAQRAVPGLRVVVFDDGSTDATVEVVRRTAAGDPRVRVMTGDAPPPGWLGKPYACQRMAEGDDAPVLVFVDADVVLAPHAVAAAVQLLDGFDLLCPYPKLLADSPSERLFQPLLPWSWLTFVPVRLMERPRPAALVAAGGQFLVVRREGYTRVGGHAAVRDRVLEDVELARVVKRSGGRIAIAEGSTLATCRMYSSWPQLRAGYAKSLWAAFGPPGAAVAAAAVLVALYVVPPVAAVVGAATGNASMFAAGICGYGLGVLGRFLSAVATGGRGWPDALAHPASVGLLAWLVGVSLRGRRRGTLVWKGRGVAA